MHIVVDRRHNVFFCNMLRNQFMNILMNCFFQLIDISGCLFQEFSKYRIVYQFSYANFFRINSTYSLEIYHHIRKYFDITVTFFSCDPHIWNSCILDGICKFSVNDSSCFCNYFTCHRTYYVFGQRMSCDTVLEHKLLIKFITSNLCKVITSRVKEHAGDQTFCTVYSKRFTRTDLLI